MGAQLPYRAVEVPDIAVGARLHHPALHGREDEGGELPAHAVRWKPLPGRLQAPMDRLEPRGEVGGEALTHGQVRLVQLERQAGQEQSYRSCWQRTGAEAYDVVTGFKSGDGWAPGLRVHMQRSGPSPGT